MQYLPVLAKHKLKLFAASAIVVGALILLVRWSTAPAAEAPTQPETLAAVAEIEEQAPAEPSAAATPESLVVVYVSGAVRAPDVYQLAKTARVKDLVVAAGGFTAEADPEQINLAEHLSDGQHIHVPRQGEIGLAEAADDLGSASTTPTAAFDINTASAAELDGLPGIGQALAQRIIEYRTANGPFKAAEDLRKVKGIGPALFDKIAPLIVVGP